jgi:aldehyde dehydrogenase (NAD+)
LEITLFSGHPDLIDTRHPFLIGGRLVEGTGQAEIEVENPATEAIIATVPDVSVRDVGAAIEAARRAFDAGPWTTMSGGDRSAILHRWIDLAEEQSEPLVDLLVSEVGTPVTLARSLQTKMAFQYGRWLADAAARGPRGGWEQDAGIHHDPVTTASLFVRESVGVTLAITAYNFPLIMFITKVFSALASGGSSVVLCSPQTPLSTLAFARLSLEAGVPEGQVNALVGGADVGRFACEHPAVDMVTFTGSVQVGQDILRQSAGTLKKVTLELGGKSPNVILPGIPIESVVPQSILRFARNAGQGCGCTTRILVPRQSYVEFIDRARSFIVEIKTGDPTDPETFVGPLISGSQRKRVEGYVDRAIESGAVLEAGGTRPDLPTGYYMNTTLVGGVANTSEICQEELFGPVGVVLPYDTVEEAVATANATRFGLNANVFGPLDDALDVARRIRSGTVTINGGGGARADAPFGGYGHSGIGRELGEEGLLEFLEVKHIQWPLAGVGQTTGT